MKWFNNMRVSMKIIVGFGVVLLTMLILVASVVITNQMTNRSLETVIGLSKLSSRSNDALDAFNEARIGVSTLYEGYSAEAETIVTNEHAVIRGYLRDVKDIISSSPELAEYASGADKVTDSMESWINSTVSLIADDSVLAGMQRQFSSILSSAVDLAHDEIYLAQFENLDTDIKEEKDFDALARRRNRVYHGSEIVVGALEIGTSFESLIAYHDLSARAEAVAFGEEIIELVEQYREDSSQDKDKEGAQAVIDTLTQYMGMIDEYVSYINSKNNIVAATQRLDAQTSEAVFDFISILDAAVEKEMNNAENAGMTALILSISLSAVAMLVGVAVAVLLNSSISKPLAPLTAFMKKAGTTGDIILTKDDAAAIENYAENKDEIGQTIAGAASFVTRITQISEALDTIAHGDLTVDVSVLSEKDTMGNSLKDMVSQLNDMFGEINASTGQVSAGARQIAEGSQILAQGSTEQAASVQQLSSSMTEIAGKTKDNAEMAGRAAILADTIKGNAEKGTRQMDDMISAVNEINNASQNISKVIKTIDDIAFQTNILALNAAVEAARAGQHGKGFAVVAEEVRNLAAKSAAAASDTSELIENSIEKANVGVRIAGETAESLSDIVKGINESSAIINDIAQSSDEQQASIEQINNGIDQVAKVVQQNSATAEQSAAASQEMSGQSSVLQSLIEQFKIKNTGIPGMSLPQPRHSANGNAYTPEQNNPDDQTEYTGGFGKY